MDSKKKWYLVVLVLGGAVLIVDRVILSEGATDPTAVLAAPDSVPAGGTPTFVAPAAAASPIPEVPFPVGVTSLGPDHVLRDLFAQPKSAIGQGDSVDNVRRSGSAADPGFGRVTASAFMTRHRLQAVLRNPTLTIAVVDGTWVHVGESVDDCTLTAIENETAHFECFDAAVTLTVAMWQRHQPD